jgi:hypothetical protein
LRDTIKEEKGNCCEICEHWCGDNGSPHHIVKISEEPLLRDCKSNILWLCFDCHRLTEDKPGYNARLQLELQKRYFKKFLINRFYTPEEIAQIVIMPVKDLEKAINKGRLKFEYVDGVRKSQGLEIIRFLMGGKIHE